MKKTITAYSRYSALAAKCLAFFLLSAPALAFSQEKILAVMSGETKIYQEFYSRLENTLNGAITLSKINLAQLSNAQLNKYNLIIPVGYKAAVAVSKHETTSVVIYSLIPNNKLLGTTIPCINNTSCYKVFIDQPVSRYIALFRVLFPKSHNLAFATTQATTTRSQQIKSAADKNGITFKEIYFAADDNIVRTLSNKLNSHDILLALPDPAIYNKSNAKNIILSSYHKNVAIIAYSKSFTRAGALISLYSSIDNIADKTSALAKEIIVNGPQKIKEYFPDDFSIEINSAVARSLNIDIDSENSIKRKIK